MGYLRVPPGVAKAPIVIIIAGNDARKEEFLIRGMATISYDGPGPGEVWEYLNIAFARTITANNLAYTTWSSSTLWESCIEN